MTSSPDAWGDFGFDVSPSSVPLKSIELDDDMSWANAPNIAEPKPKQRGTTSVVRQVPLVTTNQRSIHLTATPASSPTDDSLLRKRTSASISSPSSSLKEPDVIQPDEFVVDFYAQLQEWYGPIGIRGKKQLYFNMIKSGLVLEETITYTSPPEEDITPTTAPDTNKDTDSLIPPYDSSASFFRNLLKSVRPTNSSVKIKRRVLEPVYWVFDDHPLWKLLYVNDGSDFVLSKMSMGESTSMIAVSETVVNRLVDIMWSELVRCKLVGQSIFGSGVDDINETSQSSSGESDPTQGKRFVTTSIL